MEKITFKEIEYLMDKVNGEFGNRNNYCLFCNSKTYNSKVGIVHHKNCVIIRLREEISKEKR